MSLIIKTIRHQIHENDAQNIQCVSNSRHKVSVTKNKKLTLFNDISGEVFGFSGVQLRSYIFLIC